MSVKEEIRKRLSGTYYSELPIEYGYKALKADLELALSEIPDRRAGRPPKAQSATPRVRPKIVKPIEKAPEKPAEAPTECPKCKGTDISLLSPGIWKCENASCRFKINPALQAEIAADVAAEESGEEIKHAEPDPTAVAKPESLGIGPPPKAGADFGEYDPNRIRK